MDSIRVCVIKRSDKSNYYMQYRDPITGKLAERKSTGVPAVEKRRKDALRAAAKWEEELNSQSYSRDAVDLSWAEWRDRCDREYMPTLEDKTRRCYATALNAFERVIGQPRRMSLVDYALLARFAAELRNPSKKAKQPKQSKPPAGQGTTEPKKKMGQPVKERVSEATIASYLRGLSAVFGWAVEMRYLRAVPAMPKLRGRQRANRAKMKGRPITREEFERMLAAVPAVVGREAAKCWRRLLAGLWWSGLRLDEALHLYWDFAPSDPRAIVIVSDGQHPMLLIPGQAQKSGKDQLYPIAPEFWRFLEKQWTDTDRQGRVFRLTSPKGNPVRNLQVVSAYISAIGKNAGVVVDAAKGKFASAHDLRRSFGLRWASRPHVLPQLLKELMRHADITTTMSYYVGSLADTTAAAIWKAYKADKRPSKGTQKGTQKDQKTAKPE